MRKLRTHSLCGRIGRLGATGGNLADVSHNRDSITVPFQTGVEGFV